MRILRVLFLDAECSATVATRLQILGQTRPGICGISSLFLFPATEHSILSLWLKLSSWSATADALRSFEPVKKVWLLLEICTFYHFRQKHLCIFYIVLYLYMSNNNYGPLFRYFGFKVLAGWFCLYFLLRRVKYLIFVWQVFREKAPATSTPFSNRLTLSILHYNDVLLTCLKQYKLSISFIQNIV